MSYGELTLPPEWNGLSDKGRYLKGHIPHNKGKKWGDYLTKRAMKGSAKGWKNLEKYRHRERPDVFERFRKEVIAVADDGSFHYFSCLTAAAEWVGGNRRSVGRCCSQNKKRAILKDSRGNLTGKKNTDHKYMGYRFYYENDNLWTKKIKR